MSREDVFLSICSASNAVALEPRRGWPGRARVTLPNGSTQDVLIHACPLTTHARQIEGELRLQPPAQNRPVQDEPDAIPLIIGISSTGTLVAADAYRRLGRNERWTITFRENLVTEAARLGWATVLRPITPSGMEDVYAFQPALLPVYIEMRERDVKVDPLIIRALVDGSGLLATPNDAGARERARQATSRLMRDAAFSRDVREAYGNECALCGLSLGLVVGAHVFPASAPNSPDEVQNGICLCENHHRALDKHLIHIDPVTRAVTLHPTIRESAATNAAAQAFISGTYEMLRSTANPNHNVAVNMLSRRYEYFTGLYDWVGRR